jgi:predicted transporter
MKIQTRITLLISNLIFITGIIFLCLALGWKLGLGIGFICWAFYCLQEIHDI